MMLTKLLLALIRGYKYIISPILPAACRYFPSCSEYAAEALEKHGLIYGCYLTIGRLLRCNPFGSHGFDPVPECKRHNKVTSKE